MTMPSHIESDARSERADWLEQALAADAAQHRDAYIDDDGFTARVMQVLPAAAAMPRWRKPALVALWVAAALALLGALPGAVLDVAREAFRLASARPFSLSEVGVILVALACITWAAAAFALRRE